MSDSQAGDIVPRKINIFYSEDLATKVAELYMEGESLLAISRHAGMPAYGTLINWASNNATFREKLNSAREMRAFYFEEAARAAAESVSEKDDVPAARLKFDAYKWSAEVNDPGRYAKKTTLSGDAQNPIRFNVTTGFPEPNEFQTAPELGPDGLIVRKKIAAEVHETAREAVTEAELVEESECAPET